MRIIIELIIPCLPKRPQSLHYHFAEAEIGKSSRGRLDCEGVRLGNALATDSYCCEVAGTVGQVIPEGPNMFKNNCTKAL
ncbi:hypothetical protein KEM48_007216 [Puccinia striiformis f. sp. tritici PST-130]|nr:hypothetical protein KEM48_007216 [Puccinia striiformis f. sp. tritici PST-130]